MSKLDAGFLICRFVPMVSSYFGIYTMISEQMDQILILKRVSFPITVYRKHVFWVSVDHVTTAAQSTQSTHGSSFYNASMD